MIPSILVLLISFNWVKSLPDYPIVELINYNNPFFWFASCEVSIIYYYGIFYSYAPWIVYVCYLFGSISND